MPDYQKRQLAGSVDIGDPGPLPADLQGLADADLANLNWTYEPLGYRGYGFFPIMDPVVPNSITNYQTARELIERDGLDATLALIEGSGNEPLKAYFARETTFRRDAQHVDELRVLLSMTNDDMDDFFLAAKAW